MNIVHMCTYLIFYVYSPNKHNNIYKKHFLLYILYKSDCNLAVPTYFQNFHIYRNLIKEQRGTAV